MTPTEREFGELISAVKNVSEDCRVLFDKFDKYTEKHGDIHVAISRQLGGIAVITAILLLAAGAALTKLFGGS